MTVIHVSDLHINIPDFALEPERLWTKVFESSFGVDIDFKNHQTFSSRYYLRSEDEPSIRDFFTEDVIEYLESHEDLHIESHRSKLIIYLKRDELSVAEISAVLSFVNEFVIRLEEIKIRV